MQHLGLMWLAMMCGVLSLLVGTAFPTPTEEAYRRGLDAYNRQDYSIALRAWRPLAQRGHANAQTNLGVMYENGRGVPRKDTEAARWYRKAAEQGHPWGQYILGGMYENGRGVGQDPTEAVQWYRKATEQGHARGQINLGRMYDNGRGVIQNDAEAVKWYRKVAEQGGAWGQFNLGFMYENGWGVAQDLAQAHYWFAQAAEAYPPGPDRKNARQAQERIARQLATGQTPAPASSPRPPLASAPPAPQPRPSTPAVSPLTPSTSPTPPVPTTTAVPYRRALIIGNTNYPTSPLRNPGNDATAMAKFLAHEAGFQVYKGQALLDINRQTLVSAISDFADAIRHGDTVVFYFSGHGLERQGLNYLLPINFAAQNAAQLPYEAPTAQDIQKQLLAGEPSMTIMILDACRDLPEAFKSLRGRAGGRGLAFMSADSGSTAQQVIMFATAPGTTASDGGTLGNGTFTHCLLRSFQQPGIDSRIAFGDVVQCVLDKTNREQSPFLVTSQRQRFVFK
jgi:Caspase domain/Sel1 repeat